MTNAGDGIRVALLRFLEAEVVLTPGILMGDAVARAAQLVKGIPGSIMLDQFRNPANPEIHRWVAHLFRGGGHESVRRFAYPPARRD